MSAESIDDYRCRLRKRLLVLRDKMSSLPNGVASKLCIVCVRRTVTSSEDSLSKLLARVSDEFGKGDDSVMKLDTPVDQMQSSSGSRDWEMVKKRLETCFSAAFVQRLGAYDAEVCRLPRDCAHRCRCMAISRRGGHH
jgi:hypothetical protein